MLVSPDNIKLYIPQRAPMIMVDALIEHNAESSVSSFAILPDNIFVIEGTFQPAGMTENIAQTAALRSGYDFALQQLSSDAEAPKPPVGFIGEVKNLHIHYLPPVGSVINTTVTVLHTVFSASIVNGKVMYGDTLAAECEMKIFIQ
jgi:predicted hotdog family 3-hydroxylacyl-ACP dehydratase